MTIRVILADDHSVFREGLASLIRVEDDLDVVGEAANGEEAIDLVRRLSPDVIVMDITMPVCDGIEATERILAEKPSCRVLALSMHADAQFMQKMFSLGTKGYLPKNCCFDELVTAIRTIHDNGVYLSPSLNTLLLNDYVSLLSKKKERETLPLSEREIEVLKLITEGGHTKEIADILCISVKTIETHRRQIMEKLGITTVAGLTRYAIRIGLIDL